MYLNHIKVIVFDLDGTVYEDTHHFDYYANRLEEKLPSDKRASFRDDYRLALDGLHALKIGRVYDAENDLILVQLDGTVNEAFHWDGSPLNQEELEKLYSNPIIIDQEKMFSIGDLWWVPNSIARHYGLKNEDTTKSFLEAREYMMSPDFQMNPIPGFKETLESIRNVVKIVLLTNSPQPDSEAILTKLGLANVFHHKIFQGRKPTETPKRFEEIRSHFGVSYEEILSIGDNWLNEILPAERLGCSTIYIDPHGIGSKDSADLVVKEIGEVIPILQKLTNK